MCGLTGFCDFNLRLKKADLDAANVVLQHRGPDSGDTVFFNTQMAAIGLGHRRLSILDVSMNGSQPMFSDDKEIVIVLNGEIYNFKEIREELIIKGYKFHSDSDTEVVLKAYQEFGIAAVNKFIGMFAFVIYDIKMQKLFLLRDRAGVKPLYYFYKNDCLLFASELKSIYTYAGFQKNINESAITLYFKYGYIPAPHTIFKDTYKVRPGHYLEVDLSQKKIREEKYYDVLDYYNKPKLKITEEDAADEVEKLFASAFQYRMVSDVPVGVFLSGGYDSSVVTAILQKNNASPVKTFTIGFNDEKYNEAIHARKIANYLGTEHHEFYCTTKEAQEILPLLPEIFDEPFGDSSAIPTILVSKMARKEVTVSLSADGGDEIFAGYKKYGTLKKINYLFNKYPKILFKGGKGVLDTVYNNFPFLVNTRPKGLRLSDAIGEHYKGTVHGVAEVWGRQLQEIELQKLLPGYINSLGLFDDIALINKNNDVVNTCLALDYKTYMVDDVLVKVDRATMSVGLEGREPLLDNRIIEFVAQLPSELKYGNGESKYLLKKIAHQYIPQALLERPKMGFSLPVGNWLKNELKEYLFTYINREQLARHHYIDIENAIALRDKFLAGKSTDDLQIWYLLMFQMWWDKWM